MSRSARCVAALASIVAFVGSSAAASPPAVPPPAAAAGGSALQRSYPSPDSALMARLDLGGFILVFRHEKTDYGQKDVAGLDFADRSRQRNLTVEGQTEAKEIGREIAALRIPVGTVLSSPMWRCRDTATLEFGRDDTTIDLFQKGAASRAARIRLLSTPPRPGTNTALVTHQDVLLPITKLRRDELAEGDALIVKPLGHGSFQVLAQVTPADWNRLSRSHKL